MSKDLKYTKETESGIAVQYQIDRGTKILRFRLPNGCPPKLIDKIKTTARKTDCVLTRSVEINGITGKMLLRGSTEKMMNTVIDRIASTIDAYYKAETDPMAKPNKSDAFVLSISHWSPRPRTRRRRRGRTLRSQTA